MNKEKRTPGGKNDKAKSVVTGNRTQVICLEDSYAYDNTTNAMWSHLNLWSDLVMSIGYEQFKVNSLVTAYNQLDGKRNTTVSKLYSFILKSGYC